jgi:peptidoglycan-N-acetylglucosamine deacetylase
MLPRLEGRSRPDFRSGSRSPWFLNRRSSVFWFSGVCLTVAIALGWGSWHLHKSRTVQLFGELVRSVATQDSVVALTFDDGPAAPYTDSILDLLGAYRVPATFFVTGRSVDRHPELARRIVAEGHELGNHSFSHRHMVLRSPRFIRYEVETTDSLIREAGFDGTIHFRPPYGKRLVGLPWYLARTGRATVLWTLEPDSRYRTAEDMTRHVLERVEPGAIILLHVELPERRAERAALVQIIEGLQERGYAFVTVSDLIALRIP